MKTTFQRRDRDRESSYTVSEATTLLPFLLVHIKGKSRNNVKSLLSRKLVTVDGRPTSQFDTPLAPGQVVTILSVPAPKSGALPFPLLYEDEHLIVVNKPAKLLSVATDKEKTRTAYHIVTDYVKSQHIDNRIYVLHRLDRDTSGVLMFARDLETKELFQTKWNEIITRRGYRALVEGTPQPDRDTIRSYLVETRTHMIFSGAPGPGAQGSRHQLPGAQIGGRLLPAGHLHRHRAEKPDPGPHEGAGLPHRRGQAVRRPYQPHRTAVPACQ